MSTRWGQPPRKTHTSNYAGKPIQQILDPWEESVVVHKKDPGVSVLATEPTKGVPEVVDCAVEDRQTWNSKVCARTRDTYLYRFGPPE